MKAIHIKTIKQYRKLALMFNNSPRRVLYYAGRCHYNDIFKPHNSTLRIIILFLTLAFCYSTFLSGRVAVAESTTFTINNNNTVLELTVPSSINLELNPTTGTDFGTVILPIGVGTNNQYGYVLSMTASSDALTRTSDVVDGGGNTISPTPTINSITSSYSPSSFEASSDTLNTWGYKLSNSTNYLPIPASTTTLKITASPSNSTNITTGTGDINLSFAAKVDTTTPAGTYQTTINFTAVTNAVTRYIQDFTLSDCATLADSDNYLVFDRRDNNDYTVRYINGECWMTQNLRITGIISAEDSNFTGEDFNVSEYSLSSSDSSYANHCDYTNGYNYACSKVSNNKTTGAWYNYYAASAGTVATDSNASVATSDICPSNWRLPSGPSTQYNTNFSNLTGNTSSGYQEPTTGLLLFDAVNGGYYNNGALTAQLVGFWWSRIASNIMNRYDLRYNSDSGQFRGNSGIGRYNGAFIRCVRSS